MLRQLKRGIGCVTAIMILLAASMDLFPCTSVVVGIKAARDGALIFGHNEDDPDTRVVNAWKVPRMRHDPGETVEFKDGAEIAQVPETWAMIWFQVNGLEFSDYFCNEWGVAVASDACPSREDHPDLTDGGIGFPLRKIIAERAKTAREGVKIAGGLLDRFGYVSSGRTLVICDPNEGWLLSMVKGKHWIAQRVPDDAVVVLPNTFVIRRIDLADTADFISSKDDIIDYAMMRGWWSPNTDGPFDFTKAYRIRGFNSSELKKQHFDLRQWRGLSLLSKQKVSEKKAEKNGLPFFIKPEKQLGIEDVMALLRDHYEGTKYAVHQSKYANPHFQGERSICSSTTLFSIVAELRNFLPRPLCARLWVAFGRPDTGPYVPWYTGITEVPRGFHNMPSADTHEQAFAHHFNPVPGTFDPDSTSAFWIFKRLSDLVDQRYFDDIPTVRTAWKDFEKTIFTCCEKSESEVLNLLRKNPEGAAEYMTRRTHSLAQESIQIAKGLIRQIGPAQKSQRF